MATLSQRTLMGAGCNHFHPTCETSLADRGYPPREMVSLNELRTLFNLPMNLLRAFCLRGCPRYWIEQEDGSVAIIFHPHEFLGWMLITRMGPNWAWCPQSLGQCYHDYEIDAFCRNSNDLDAVHTFALEFKRFVESRARS